MSYLYVHLKQRNIKEAIEIMNKMKTLKLCNERIGDLEIISLAIALENNTTIHTINLKNSGIDDKGMISLSRALETNTTIHTINLCDNSIGDEGMKLLASALRKNTTIHTIDLSNNSMGAEGITSLAHALEQNAAIHTIDLSNNNIGDEGMISLANALEKNITIHTIDLSNNSMGAEGITSLAHALEKNTTIHTIDLSNNNIGDEGMISLANALEKNTSMHTINLSNNRISNKGMKSLVSALEKNTSIHTIDLSGTSLNIEGMKSLAKLIKYQAENAGLSLTNITGVNLGGSIFRSILDLDDSFTNKDNEVILKFLKEGKGIDIYRAMLILVGAGNVGKTTLVKRLKAIDSGPMKADERVMTDGIEISEIKFEKPDSNGEIVFTVYDFAGQEDYLHTHALFFRKDSIFLVLHKYDDSSSAEAKRMEHELDIFLKMIASCAPGARVVLALTHCDSCDNRASKDWIQTLTSRHEHLNFTLNSFGQPFEIDSISGMNIETIKQVMIDEAMKYEKIKVSIPRSFLNLRASLDQLSQFSVSQDIFAEIAKTYVKDDVISVARDIFKSWGLIYILSNGHIVLKPQKLANVLACVFTRNEKSQEKMQPYTWGGYFKHSNKVLRAIWGNKSKGYAKELWSIKDGTSPFLDLLHDSGLAYPLFAEGVSLCKSVIPSMLSATPLNLTSFTSMPEKEMLESIFGEMYKTVHPCIKLTFHPNLPPTFLSQLQSRVSLRTVIGATWKYGCAIESIQSDEKRSCAILYVTDDKADTIYVLSAGTDENKTAARDSILISVHDLIIDKFDSLVCEVDFSGKCETLVVTEGSAKFRLATYLDSSTKSEFSNIIDKSCRNVDEIFITTALASRQVFSSISLHQLQSHALEPSITSLSNYIWTAIPDLLEITIGQPNKESEVDDKLLGIWVIFKDPYKMNQFHAIHLYYNDGDKVWICDSNYDLYSNSIEFESSTEAINCHKNSEDVIEMIKQVFKRLHLPGTVSPSDQDDPWSLLVCMDIMKIDGGKIKEKLLNHEKNYFKLRPKINDKVKRLVHDCLNYCYLNQGTSKQIETLINKVDAGFMEMRLQFQKLTTLIKTKDRKLPSTFVVLSVDKTRSRAREAVAAATQEMYNMFLSSTSISFVSSFLQNKVCDLYLLCECCKQMRGEPYQIMSPKETIATFLPLAIVGLSILSLANTIGHGLPLPDISPIVDSCRSLVDDIRNDNGKKLQDLQSQFCKETMKGKASSKDDYFFAQQFGLFLDEIDIEKRWRKSLCLMEVDGEYLFICSSCAGCRKIKEIGDDIDDDDSDTSSTDGKHRKKCIIA